MMGGMGAVIVGLVALLIVVPLMKKFNTYAQKKNEEIQAQRDEKKRNSEQ